MSILDTRIYRWLETATDFFLLNLLWLVACLPVVTIFPSTAAMFGVVRDWVRGKDGSLTRTFITRFRENLGLSLLVGAIWTVFGVALFLDFMVANQLSYWAEIILKSVLVLVSTVYAFGSVYLFPVMVHYETDWKTVIKNSLLISIGRMPTTVLLPNYKHMGTQISSPTLRERCRPVGIGEVLAVVLDQRLVDTEGRSPMQSGAYPYGTTRCSA
jgi:uncharacterized membrane protein YesL